MRNGDREKLLRATIWLQTGAGLSRQALAALTLSGADVAELYMRPESALSLKGAVLADATANRMVACVPDERQIDKVIGLMYSKGIQAVFYGDEEYPDSLTKIDVPPAVLYAIGDVKLMKTLCVAVVGSRSVSHDGERATEIFTEALVRHSVTVVSGLARGVDSKAHSVALKNGGMTIAVLGNGADIPYPSQNRYLYEEIIKKNGLILSEYCPGTSALPFHFPERNRIVSGLSKAVLVPEASSVKSGSLITANYALEQGKELYIVPHSIFNRYGKGGNAYLERLQGAIAVSPETVISGLGLRYKSKSEPAIAVDGMQKTIIERLKKGNAHFEELMMITGMKVAELNATLATMEILGLIYKAENNCYGAN